MMCATFAQSMLERAVRLYRFAAETLHLMVGLPDYAKYVEHRRRHHPEMRVMSREEFFRKCQDQRYAAHGGRGIRCC